jgi:amino acid adenylation domain-containing protein
MIVSMFGVLKAGGAYVPIDPAYPAARQALMLNNAGAPVVLTERRLMHKLAPLRTTKVICLDDPEVFAGSDSNPKRTAIDANLAYVNYTSGSTGDPKGVMIPHRSVMNVMFWLQSAFPLGEQDRVLQNISFSFDPSVLEILAPLLVGGRLVLAQPGGHQDPDYLVQTILQRQVTVIHLVPSMLRMVLQSPELKACSSLRHVFCGGEALTGDLARGFFEVLNAELHHFYGPTEVAITSVFYSVPRDHLSQIIPIGRPVANTQAHVLDSKQRHVPIGVPGELYLGGVQVGRGYYNKRELTEERFIADPFSKGASTRLYKTGDLVRYLPNGEIQFLGRTDNQVKVRGHRIELGEIESAIMLHPAAQESIVVVREDPPADKRLVAYVRSATRCASLVPELRSLLKEQLPTYMVPSAFVLLDGFPMTPNGKLDRIALPPPDARSPESEELELHVPPRTSTENVLVGIWCELLGVNQVSVLDSFFELGGHSLMLVQLISRIKQVLNVSLGVPELFQNPTIETLGRIIDSQPSMKKRKARVVQLHQGDAGPSVYLIYAGPDELRLAELMDKSYRIFGIEAPWPLVWREAVANNQIAAFPSMEQLAAPYVAALNSHERSSSCVLAGHSFAGLIAFEVAHQIQRQGGHVDTVMLFDTWAKYTTAREAAWRQWQQLWLPARNGISTDQPLQSIGSRLNRSWRIGRWILRREASEIYRALFPKRTKLSTMLDEEGVPLPWWLVERLYMKIIESYRPLPLSSRGILFRSARADEGVTLDDSLGWKNLFNRGLEIIPVFGDHLSLLRQHNRTLAQEMNEVLKRY